MSIPPRYQTSNGHKRHIKDKQGPNVAYSVFYHCKRHIKDIVWISTNVVYMSFISLIKFQSGWAFCCLQNVLANGSLNGIAQLSRADSRWLFEFRVKSSPHFSLSVSLLTSRQPNLLLAFFPLLPPYGALFQRTKESRPGRLSFCVSSPHFFNIESKVADCLPVAASAAQVGVARAGRKLKVQNHNIRSLTLRPYTLSFEF